MTPEKSLLKYSKELYQKNSEGIEPNIVGLQDELRAFRSSLQEAVKKPDDFWRKQRANILKRIQIPASAPKYRPTLRWASVTIIALLCLTVFVERGKKPVPDFAAGYDQNLLIEVESSLNRKYTDALAVDPVFDQEIERMTIKSGHASISN